MRYIFLITILITLFSCKKEKVEPYHGEDGIAFYGTADEGVVAYSFAYNLTPVLRDTIFFKMRVTGSAANFPRKISVKAVTDGTTARAGVDYELPDITLAAGATTVDYPVVLLNSPEMLNTSFILKAEIVETSDLKLGSFGNVPPNEVNYRQIQIEITNRIIRPDTWQDGIFGTFSATKLRFMIKVLNITDFSFEAIGYSGQLSYPILLRNALAEEEAISGPMIDENGDRVTF